MTKDKALRLALEALEQWNTPLYKRGAVITAIKEALETKDEPVSMRMPKVGDRVVCIEDESLGVVHYLTAGGSPEIRFDDGSHGTYLLREFAELFGYADTTPQQRKPLTDEELIIIKGKTCPEIDWESRRYVELNNGEHNQWLFDWFTAFARAIEAAHGIKE